MTSAALNAWLWAIFALALFLVGGTTNWLLFTIAISQAWAATDYIAARIEARSDETAKRAQPEGREPDTAAQTPTPTL